MYILLTQNILRNYRVMTKTIKKQGTIISDTATLMTLPFNSKLLVFFDNSINLSYLIDVKRALGLDIIVAVNNLEDKRMLESIFVTRIVDWDYIDGELVSTITINDEEQMSVLSKVRSKKNILVPRGLYDAAAKIVASRNNSDVMKELASTFMNLLDAENYYDSEYAKNMETISDLTVKVNEYEEAINSMSRDFDDFIRAYKIVQTQAAARNIVDVIKDNNMVTLPANITSLVIKNYGIPSLLRFIMALKDCLTVSFDRYVKVLYIAEPDSVSIQEINQNRFLLLGSETKAADLLRTDMFLCIGNTKEPLEFLTSSSSLDILIIIDSRRTTNQLIRGGTISLNAAMDADIANNMGLDPKNTITSSERSVYTLREADFLNKKRHALRNNDLVIRIANTLVGGT